MKKKEKKNEKKLHFHRFYAIIVMDGFLPFYDSKCDTYIHIYIHMSVNASRA